jgi:CRP/FNR family cyclic AMP-dependent transcriptional regulator
VGWSWLVEPHIWQFDAHVVEFTRATAVNGRCLRNKCSVNRELGYEILSRVSRIVADRLDATRARLEECLRQQAEG